MHGISLPLISLLFYVGLSNGKHVQDKILSTTEDWKFITRFCFLSEKGRLRYKFQYPVAYKPHNILLYYDDLSQWSAVYPSEKTCAEKVSVLEDGVNQIITLTDSYPKEYWPYCEKVTESNGYEIISCELNEPPLRFRSMRERWWYIAVSRCNPTNGVIGLNLTYDLHLTNGDDGDVLHEEFSADEFYILPIYGTFFGIYFIVCGISCIFAVILNKRLLLHSTFKMYMVTVFIWWFSRLIFLIAYAKYAGDGFDVSAIKRTGRVFEAISEIVFVLMLSLMAKGFSITRGKLPFHSVLKLCIFFSIYVITYICLFIVEAATFDPALVLYIYESPAGYGLIIIKILAWVWFAYSVFFSLKRFPNRAGFYIPFFVCYTAWFWAGPIVILIAMFAMELWTREKTVVGVENFVVLCGHIFFLVLTRPNAASDNFPYQIKTSQIGQLEGLPGERGRMFEVTEETAQDEGPNLSALFVISSTRSESTKGDSVNRAMSPDEFNRMSGIRTADLPPPTYAECAPRGSQLPPLRGALAPAETLLAT